MSRLEVVFLQGFGEGVVVIGEDEGAVTKLPGGEGFVDGHDAGVLNLLPLLHDSQDGLFVG